MLSWVRKWLGMGLPDLTEVRAERDVLQARMSEQALRISSLSARLQQQRTDAEALAHHAHSQLTVQLHDALAEVQRLKDELECKEKQLTRVKQTLDEKDKLNQQHHTLYGNSCNPKDKVIILERELSSAQCRIGQLEALARGLETDKGEMQASLRDLRRVVAEKEDQLQELMALKLDEEQKEDKSEVIDGKASARTLSDIVSISEFDEQDLQMRRAELKAHNLSISGAPYDTGDKTANRTNPPELQRANMSSLNLEYADHFDLTSYTPRADSLPAHLTSTQNKDVLKQFKRNINETTVFGTAEKPFDNQHSQQIADNCSIYPNRDVSDSKNVSVEPKKINFSVEPSHDNRTEEEEFTSLRELGITLDIRQENFPDILTQLKYEIKKAKTELDSCKSELKNAEEQLCEFPALKEEVEELKSLLENTMATMENDKKFYENQLENFSSNKKLLEQRLTELSREVDEKSKDIHLLKEDILRRENMILELAKEKRNINNKMSELELKIEELQSRNAILEKFESENEQMREKVVELHKLEQMVSEKNHQIDSLNQHLDRLDDLQRNLDDKNDELENMKEAFDEKVKEMFQMQEAVEELNKEMTKVTDDNNVLNKINKDLKLKLSKLEKDQENSSLKLQTSETELGRLNSLNNELTSKIEELKQLNDKLKDKETEIEILNEDINSYHEEIATLKEQLKMVSRSPSPRKSEDKRPDRQACGDKKQLAKIRKQISLLQYELDFNRKELNDKAFELAKAKLDLTELMSNSSQASKELAAKEAANSYLQHQVQELQAERRALSEQLEKIGDRIREESNLEELKAKLQEKSRRCRELETELQELREIVQRSSSMALALPGRGARSPTAELERALRDQLEYSHELDEDIMEQILSASSDEREEIPRLALNTSKSSSSVQSSSSERIGRLRSENEKLQMQVTHLESRVKDKDALISELNRIRDKLSNECQTSKLRYEAERDNSARLELLLAAHKDTAQSLQNQDSNMIQILKKRLESAMQSSLESQHAEQQQRARVAQLERQALAGDGGGGGGGLQAEMENNERLKGEISLLKSKLEVERNRYGDLQASLEHSRLQAQRDLEAKAEQCTQLRSELVELKRLKHEAGVELVRARELLGVQAAAMQQLQKKIATLQQRPAEALTELQSPKPADLSRASLQTRVDTKDKPQTQDDKDHAIRYLHGRCLRLESCRKALVWQKRYLQRVLAGYTELENTLRPSSGRASGPKRFKVLAWSVVGVLRMQFLVRRRLGVRALAAHALLRPHAPHAHVTAPAQASTPTHAPQPTTPLTAYNSPAPARDSLARRVLRHDLRLNLPSSPHLDFVRRSPYNTSSPREEPFILSSPRGEVATAYLNKLELVTRCLNHAMDAARDVP